MNFDGVESVVRDGEENDWLDVTYSERKYDAAPQKPAHKFNLWQRMSRKWKVFSIACLCILALVGVLVFSPAARNGIATAAKKAYLAVASAFERKQDTSATKFDIPCNAELMDVKDGVATFGGGRAALSFCGGKVTKVDENSVTVQLGDDLLLCYGGLTSVYVAEGQSVQANELLGKYDSTFTATIVKGETTVTDVVASDNSIAWNV